MKSLLKIYLLLFVVALLSCNDREQDRLKESAVRLERMNNIGLDGNRRLEAMLNNLAFNDNTADRYEYLQSAVKNYTDNTMRFSELIVEAVKTNNTGNSAAIFKEYQALQHAYRFLEQRMSDSSRYINFDTSSRSFMSLNEQTFTQKYFSGGDSINTKLQLLFLQADAIWCEYPFLQIMVENLTPSCNFGDAIQAIGTTEKILYKRGEKMVVTTVMAEYYPANIQYGIVDGKRIEPTKGLFQYTKRITDKAGLHQSRAIVYIKRNGRMEGYATVARYQVE